MILLSCRHAFIRRWVCCLMTSFTTIHFLYGTVFIPLEYFKQFILSRTLCSKTPIAAIHYIKRTGFTSKTTAQKMRFSIMDFFSKCDQISRKLWIWSHLLKKSLMENFIFCAVNIWRVLRLLEESNCSHYFFKISFFFSELVPVIFAWRVLVMQPLFHDECVNLTRVNAAIYCHGDALYLHVIVKILRWDIFIIGIQVE